MAGFPRATGSSRTIPPTRTITASSSWSPGNTYIRNKANHGSYGFWLGGSDQTVLIGNEAAYNGLPSGFHNAPEPVFSHGGIVIVKGPSSHTLIDGNHCHHNNGAGIAFRGDDATRGGAWRTYHWIVQNNDVHDNRWGIWGRWGDWIYLANNHFANELGGKLLQDVTRLVEVKPDPDARQAPLLRLRGPERQGSANRFASAPPAAAIPRAGRSLSTGISAPATADTPAATHTFTQPGFYRVGVTVEQRRAGGPRLPRSARVVAAGTEVRHGGRSSPLGLRAGRQHGRPRQDPVRG